VKVCPIDLTLAVYPKQLLDGLRDMLIEAELTEHSVGNMHLHNLKTSQWNPASPETTEREREREREREKVKVHLEGGCE